MENREGALKLILCLFDSDGGHVYHSPSSLHLIVNSVPEWNDGLVPSWMVSGDHLHGNDLCKLDYVQDLELLQLEESVEYTIVELAEESKGVSA